MAQDELVIHSGQVTTTVGGGRIGGMSSARPTESERVEVRLVISEVDASERYEHLHVNDTFSVDGETWRLMDVRYFSAGQWEVVAVPVDTASTVTDQKNPGAPDAPDA
ncbi:DUF6406 domain-containing protein [Streptomyces smyrnaeus]|uniref:DUF6406 domain-containing protein n=1 Tax=Streptomyces smyrnaeus TaxID=1387713 RepID=UPI0016088282